ncbi:unnamed protein product, partial [Didymodactylos carnosus]
MANTDYTNTEKTGGAVNPPQYQTFNHSVQNPQQQTFSQMPPPHGVTVGQPVPIYVAQQVPFLGEHSASITCPSCHAQVLTRVDYKNELQNHLWQEYNNLGMKEGIWAPRLSKSFAKQYYTCRMLRTFSYQKLRKHAQHEYKVVRSIEHLIRQRSDIVVRRTDKSRVFYVSKTDEFAGKAEEYKLKTEAYEEITNGRLTKLALTQKQANRLSTKLNNLELGHYSGLPKLHKQYPFEWEQDLIRHQEIHNGIYGRYIDDIFMTTNQTIEEINVKLEEANSKNINIKIIPIINTSHKPTTEPYILPYTSDHPHHVHRNIPYAALLDAACICSHVHDFNSERIRIDMSLLLNNYPPNCVSKQFNRFFNLNGAMPVLNQLHEQVYYRLHQKLLYQLTRHEKQLHIMMQDPVISPVVLQENIWNSEMMYFIHGGKHILHFPNPQLNLLRFN